jgi:hypothetical protein
MLFPDSPDTIQYVLANTEIQYVLANTEIQYVLASFDPLL